LQPQGFACEGRPPKPTQQRRREGNAGKRKLPKPGKSARAGGPEADVDWLPPVGLGADGVGLWLSVVPRLLAVERSLEDAIARERERLAAAGARLCGRHRVRRQRELTRGPL